MSPTKSVEVTQPLAISPQPDYTRFCDTSNSRKDSIDISITIQDFDNSCETYFSCRDSSPLPRCVLPEASIAFRQALGRMNSDGEDSDTSFSETSGSSPPSSSLSSSASSSTGNLSDLSSSPNSFSPRQNGFLSVFSKSGCPSSPSRSPFMTSVLTSPRKFRDPTGTSCLSVTNNSQNNHLTIARRADGRRAVSFGGADIVKPRTTRRASHCEKHVSWADESGPKSQLFTVRLIRPRISPDTNPSVNSLPGQSILRASGTN